MPKAKDRDTIVVPALLARTNFGKLLRRVENERRSLVIEKRGTSRAVLLSIPDYGCDAPTYAAAERRGLAKADNDPPGERVRVAGVRWGLLREVKQRCPTKKRVGRYKNNDQTERQRLPASRKRRASPL